jgi:Site-specific recombinase XerD
MLNVDVCKRFREYLLKEATNRRTGELISKTSASGYMNSFRTLLKQAYIDKYLEKNLNDYFDAISRRRHTRTISPMRNSRTLAATPCKYDVLRRISIFAVFCGMRISDLESLRWEQIVKAPDGGWCIRKQIVKTGRWESVFISDEALSYCGERGTGKVFTGFRRSMVYGAFHEWLEDAGITYKYITFHCLRHTNATLMLGQNIDIYTVSHQLTHQNVQTTQIYTEVVDEKKRLAANAITLKI